MRINTVFAAALLAACIVAIPNISNAQQAAPTLEYSVTGEVTEADGWLTAQKAATVTVKLPREQDVIRIRGKSGGAKNGVVIGLKDEAGAVTTLGIAAEDLKLGWGAHSAKPLPDALLRLTWPGKWPNNRGAYFVRPNMDLYSDARRNDIAKVWSTLPPASEHLWTLELRRASGTTQYWLNGQFMNEVALPNLIASIEFKLAPGAALREVKAEKAEASASRVLSLPLTTYARPGEMANAQIKLLPNAALPKGLMPAETQSTPQIFVSGLGRIPSRVDDLVSYAWRRGAVDALHETRIFAVPTATYSHAQFLCAAAEDPARTPSFAVRLTRYGKSRGNAMADTTVALPVGGAALDANTRRVGDVTYGEGNDRKTVPLWLVRVPLKIGSIQDLMRDEKTQNPAFGTHRYLDFELLDPAARSSVTLFGAALEESPASLDVRSNLPHLVFYASEKPEMRATVEAREPGNYTVEWEFADVDGKVAASGKKVLALSAARPSEVLAVPVNVGNGWFATRFQLTDGKGETLVDNRSAFVFLPPDTRKAGFESPYGTWWFHWAHGGEPNIELVGPLMQRAGLRHTNLGENLPEAKTKEYKVSHWAIPWTGKFYGDLYGGRTDMAGAMAGHEEFIRKYLEQWPSVNRMMIFHESGSTSKVFPSELWGETPPPLATDVAERMKFRVTYLTELAKMVRAKFPNIKLQYGNDGNSLMLVSELMRAGFPREYMDTISTEDLGQTIVPERAILDSMQSAWFLRESARKLGYGDVPLTAAYEWMNRHSDRVGLRSQAEWHIRDALHGLAYGFDTIALGSIHDAGTGYYYSLWGGGGLTRRYPVMEPKPVYAAIATHTQVMDGAKFERKIPTGLLSLYCLEFKRGNEWVYALWTPRGERTASIKLNGGGQSTLIDMYGREKTTTGTDINLNITSAPQYVVSSQRFAGITPGKASFPDDTPPEKPFVIDAMDKAGNWTVAFDEPKWMNRKGGNIPHGTPGDFTLREVNDPEMGACLELSLNPKQLKWEAEQEFVTLKLNVPISGPGPYENAGLWVKGNGGWGEIKLQVQSEKSSLVTPGFVSFGSWSGRSSINFDGWNWMQYPLSSEANWKGSGTVVGLIITMPQYALHLTEMEKVPELKIRLKNLSLY